MCILLAARMESTGSRNKIQVSQKTAELVICGGHPELVKPRESLVFAKGKGELQTYWLTHLSELVVRLPAVTIIYRRDCPIRGSVDNSTPGSGSRYYEWWFLLLKGNFLTLALTVSILDYLVCQLEDARTFLLKNSGCSTHLQVLYFN
jgi:hypothetical protein